MPQWQIQKAARYLRNGAVIAYPTEAVWGLGCDPWQPQAVGRLLALKNRAVEKGVILVGASINQFAPLLEGLSALQRQQLECSWPGPHTWLVPHHNLLPEWVTGSHATVAIRVSAHPLVQALCTACGPLVSTSANPAGRPEARSRLRVQQYFGSELDMLVSGRLGGQKNPSQIRDLSTGALVRPA